MTHQEFIKQIEEGKIILNSDTSGQSIKLIFSGDFCPVGRVEKLCLSGNSRKIYGDMLEKIENSDVFITNLECPLTNRTNPLEKIGPHIKADPGCLDALKIGKSTIVSLANNHIMDYGEAGLLDTIAVLKKNGINFVGAGTDRNEAAKIRYLTQGKHRLAFLSVTEHEFSIADTFKAGANPLDPIENYYQIKEAKENADFVIVILHGGNEHYPLPRPGLARIFRFFADNGVSLVIGHHTHCAGGIEIHNGVPLIFSLGNFVFDWPEETFVPWFEGYALEVSLAGNVVTDLELIPYTQCQGEPEVRLMKNHERNAFLKKIAAYSATISDGELLEREWLRFSRDKRNAYIKRLFNLNKLQRLLLKYNRFTGRIIRKKRILSLLHLFRCESHHEVIVKILEDYEKEGKEGEE